LTAPHDHQQQRQFPSTHWSLVALAGSENVEVRRAALERLLHRYIIPMRAYLMRRRGMSEHEADDILQEFVCHKVLVHDLMPRADRARGKFRTFLLTALDRFALNKLRDGAVARAGTTSLDGNAVTNIVVDEGADALRSFEIAWAKELLHNAVKQVYLECMDGGRSDVWEVFQGRLLQPLLSGTDPVDYDVLAARHGIESPAATSNLLVTAKRMFVRNLRRLVGEYEPDEASIDDEIVELRAVLAGG
jgi:RNA polymerase sigma-70 factor (ECF subfamily)